MSLILFNLLIIIINGYRNDLYYTINDLLMFYTAVVTIFIFLAVGIGKDNDLDL